MLTITKNTIFKDFVYEYVHLLTINKLKVIKMINAKVSVRLYIRHI